LLLTVLLLTVGAEVARPQGWAEVDRAVGQALRRRVFPGAVVLVGRRDTVLFARGYGHLAWGAQSARPSPDSTLWDLASLTKIVATASLAMVYVDRGTLDLGAPVSRYLPPFVGQGRELITVRHLLDHTSGLRSWAPLWRESSTREEAVRLLLSERPRNKPGRAPLYSDLNAMLLGLVLERVGGASLDNLAQQEVFGPLGLSSLRFGVRPEDRRRTAPSRLEGRRPVAGTVNDDNARRLGGVAGHAGLFGTGRDLARFAQAWLAEGVVQGGPWVRAETVRQFMRRSPGAGTRTLGWDTPDTLAAGTPSLFGGAGHPGVVGHSGWTGTSMWLDPLNDLFVVILANRAVSPRGTRTLEEMRLVRAEVSEAARRAVGAGCLAVAC
jgi:CubicO group peptidase (beta-lactamase class C family)